MSVSKMVSCLHLQDERGLMNSTCHHMTGWSPCGMVPYQGLTKACNVLTTSSSSGLINIILSLWVIGVMFCGISRKFSSLHTYIIMGGKKGSLAVGKTINIYCQFHVNENCFCPSFWIRIEKYTFVKLLTTYLITEAIWICSNKDITSDR